MNRIVYRFRDIGRVISCNDRWWERGVGWGYLGMRVVILFLWSICRSWIDQQGKLCCGMID